jgi:hypothetical protein
MSSHRRSIGDGDSVLIRELRGITDNDVSRCPRQRYMHRHGRAAIGDDESLFRPADDARERGGCACSPDCAVQGVWPSR